MSSCLDGMSAYLVVVVVVVNTMHRGSGAAAVLALTDGGAFP